MLNQTCCWLVHMLPLLHHVLTICAMDAEYDALSIACGMSKSLLQVSVPLFLPAIWQAPLLSDMEAAFEAQR